MPEADQEQIGRELWEYVQKIRALRADLQAGVGSLDSGERRKFDVEDVIRRGRARHARRSEQKVEC
jgi:hypothetical protein